MGGGGFGRWWWGVYVGRGVGMYVGGGGVGG